uniref:Helicase, putative n=1 Tax=Arundo donax TaxID=35708 RepID=A0A0A9V7E8_ARUDO
MLSADLSQRFFEKQKITTGTRDFFRRLFTRGVQNEDSDLFGPEELC